LETNKIGMWDIGCKRATTAGREEGRVINSLIGRRERNSNSSPYTAQKENSCLCAGLWKDE
jgi:hypothetical protein